MSRTLLKLKREIISVVSKIFLKQVKSNYLGMPLIAPIVYGLKNGGYTVPDEIWMGDCLKAFIATKQGTILDIGVNVGLYLVKLRLISKDIPYIGFEPNPSCLLYTHELIRLNQFKNSKLIPVALAENDDIAQFYASRIGDKGGSLIKDHLNESGHKFSFDALVMNGDQLIEKFKLDNIAAIKIDVEEAEIYVLRGLLASLKKYRPYVYCEILTVADDPERIKRKDAICQLFSEIDYVVFGVTKNKDALKQITDFNEVGVNYAAEYIFCPAEDADVFVAAAKKYISIL
ncbi:MAG: FkbM family methyltransferase [Gammaproteobacteria bacterium]